MSIVTGVVEAKSKTKYGYGILVTGKWHNSKYEIKCEKGDTVEFEDGGKNYCNKLKVIAGGAGVAAPSAGKAAPRGGFPIAPLDGQRAIIRQNSLAHAIQFSVHHASFDESTVEDVISIARQFEAYSAGDLDAEEAERILEEEVV